MTSDQRINQLIAKYGMPRNRDMLHVMLGLAYQQGKVDASREARAAIKEIFSQPKLT